MRRLAATAGLAIAVAVVATAIAAPLTGNVAVNENTAETQQAPRVALQPGGGFLVAWEERDVGNGEVDVRRFGADGAPLTGATPLAAATLRQEAPDIDTAPDGSAVVTWTDGGTSDRDVLARRLTAAGSPTGSTIPVADATGTQELSRVAVSPDGTFTIVWADPAAASAGEEDIYMSRYEADGDLIDDDLAVVARPDYQLDPDVAALPDGTLVVAFWDRALAEVRARRFDADGDMLGNEISVGADAAFPPGPGRPGVDADAGGFTVAWELDDTTFVRRFGTDGTPLTGPVTVGTFPFDSPFAATAPDGRSVVAWTAPDGAEAELREYSAALAPDGGAQAVSSAGNAGQPIARGVAADAGGFVVAWEADDADETGVYARRFSWGGGAATPTPTATASPAATASPTPAPAATATPAPKPTAPKAAAPTLADVVRGLPSTRRCVSRRNFRIRLREPKGTKIRRATVKVNGKLVATRKGKRVTAPVDLRGLPKGRFKVEIRVTTTKGRIIKGTRRYRTCAAGRRK